MRVVLWIKSAMTNVDSAMHLPFSQASFIMYRYAGLSPRWTVCIFPNSFVPLRGAFNIVVTSGCRFSHKIHRHATLSLSAQDTL